MEYGERYEACQVTARKVRAARDLIELAGGYKEAVVLADAVWFVALESDESDAGSANRRTRTILSGISGGYEALGGQNPQ